MFVEEALDNIVTVDLGEGDTHTIKWLHHLPNDMATIILCTVLHYMYAL